MGFRDRLAGLGRRALGGALGALEARLGTDDAGDGVDAPTAPPGGSEPEPAVEGVDFPFGSSMAKAAKEASAVVDRQAEGSIGGGKVPTEKATDDPKSLFWDPLVIVEQLGYKDKPSPITYATLDAMVWRMPIIRAILQTRLSQVANFCRPQQDIFQPGFRIAMLDPKARPSAADKKFISGMQALFTQTGVSGNPRGRDSLETFVRKLVNDSLRYDQLTFEVVPNKKGLPAEWYAVDASTIRIADSSKLHIDEDDEDAIRYVQIYDSMVIAEFTQNELCFGVRNPNTNIKLQGYGTSELEMSMQAVTSLLWSWDYNQRFFSQGSVAKGLLNIKGAINEKQLRAFRRMWYSMISGVENAWRSPVLNADDAQWISMHSSNRDMEFSAWMDFLIKVACAIFLMDPVEVNFKYGNTGGAASMFESGNQQKMVESKDKGLKPLLRFIARQFTSHIVHPINEDFVFDFVGLEAQTQDQLAKLNFQRVKTTHTVNELRAEQDLDPIEDGDVILDPVYMQARGMRQQQEQAEQQQEAGGGMPGMPGAEGEGGPPGDAEGGGDGKPDFAAMLNQGDEDGADDEDEQKPQQPAGLKPKPFGKSITIDFTV